MAGTLCAALSVSTRGGSIPRARHSRAVDLLRPRGLSGVPGARAWRDLGGAGDLRIEHVRRRSPEPPLQSPGGSRTK
jgi:hypothetical protein